jgi:hypothetical protein
LIEHLFILGAGAIPVNRNPCLLDAYILNKLYIALQTGKMMGKIQSKIREVQEC